jgi:GntR family transcriptional regulator
LYQQVKEHLVRRVLRGEWKPGECLPSETKLAEAYGFSQGTVRKAIEELVDENLVTRHAGRGTFVRSHKGDYKPFRFHRFRAHSGERLTEGRMEYIRCTTGRAGARAAKALQISAEAEVADVERLRFLGDRPALLERIVLGTGLCAGIDRILSDQKPSSIYLVLEQYYNILIVRVDESLRARLSRPDEEDVLNLERGTPILEAERVAYSLGGEPVEWRLSVGPTDDMHYWNQTTG